MGSRRIGLGIIGCGSAARRYHAPALRALEFIEPIALFDPQPQAAHELGRMLPGVALCASVEEMLENPRVHAVGILSPPAAHFGAARMAISAGRHVLVEKPLTLDAAEAWELHRMATESGLVCATGYHLRNHRHVQEARARVSRGEIGRIRVARSLWCARRQRSLAANSWRRDQAQGGSLLDDVAVHHVDLLQYLLEQPFRDLRVSVNDAGESGSCVQLQAVTADGIPAEIAVVEGRFEWQEIELIGERGRMRLSLYDAWGFDSLTDADPVFGMGARVRRLGRGLSRVPAGIQAQLRGGDLAACYRVQWERFADAVFGEGAPAATFAHGAACVQLMAKAQRSASQEILLRPAQSVAATADVALEERKIFGADSDHGRPALSVVLGTPDEFRTIRTTVRHLQAQSARAQMELVLVGPRRLQETLEPDAVAGFWGHRVVCVDEVHSVAQVNAAGARAASGRVIAFSEDHCFPQPGWAEALIRAHREEHAVVGPAVRNANPATWVSWADFLAGYGPWMEGALNGNTGFLPGHNSSYKRYVLEALGERLEDELEAETVLHYRLSREGYSLHTEPAAVVSHVNFALVDSWADVQFLNGRMFAGLRCRDWGIGKRLVYFFGSPLIPVLRTLRSLPALRAAPIPASRKWQTVPGLFLGMCIDGFGQMVGYAAGPGSARATLARLEFHRARHIPAEERAALFV